MGINFVLAQKMEGRTPTLGRMTAIKDLVVDYGIEIIGEVPADPSPQIINGQILIGFTTRGLPFQMAVDGRHQLQPTQIPALFRFVERNITPLISNYAHQLEQEGSHTTRIDIISRFLHTIEHLRVTCVPDIKFDLAMAISYRCNGQLHCAGSNTLNTRVFIQSSNCSYHSEIDVFDTPIALDSPLSITISTRQAQLNGFVMIPSLDTQRRIASYLNNKLIAELKGAANSYINWVAQNASGFRMRHLNHNEETLAQAHRLNAVLDQDLSNHSYESIVKMVLSFYNNSLDTKHALSRYLHPVLYDNESTIVDHENSSKVFKKTIKSRFKLVF